MPKILNNEEECSFLLTQINIGKSTLVEQFAKEQYWAHDAQGLGSSYKQALLERFSISAIVIAILLSIGCDRLSSGSILKE